MNNNLLILIFAIIGLVVIIKIFLYRLVPFVDQYFLTQEVDYVERYSKGSWALITGASSGMGERFAHEFAKRKINLLLLGSAKTRKVINVITKKYPSVSIRFLQVDFSKSFRDDFFDNIQKEVDELGDKWRILINNVGYRTACSDYRKMQLSEIKKTIAVGTIVQSKLIQMALKAFTNEGKYSNNKYSNNKYSNNKYSNNKYAIINITAQNSVYTDFMATDNNITVPYLACYEATNAYGFFHAKSVYEEIKNKYPHIDYLIITPGAVITKNTEDVLKDTIFSVDVETYVQEVMRLIGNKNGVYCAYWGHSLCSLMLNLFPFMDKESITSRIGLDFSEKHVNSV
jgi:17beta-estradiol 17-dehydrogenase / very-long-chain 3-oxoacyl-CoA reductase